MSAEVQAQANGEGATTFSKDAPEFKIIHRVGAIPFVADGLTVAEQIVNSTHFTASLYSIAGGIASKSLNLATPVLVAGKGYVDVADGYANQGLDIVESRFPYPFKTPTNDMIEAAKQPAYKTYAVAKGVYDDRLAPYANSEIVQRAVDQLLAINKTLTAGAVSVKETIVNTTYTGTHALIEQFEYLQTHGKELPPKIQESLATAYTDVKAILGKPDETASQKAVEIGHYVQSIVQPELEKALAFLTAKKEKTEAKATEATEAVQEKI